MNGPWLDFLNAYVNQTQPTYSEIGIAYMLMGDNPVSNSDPYATEPTTAGDWVTDLGTFSRRRRHGRLRRVVFGAGSVCSWCDRWVVRGTIRWIWRISAECR